MPSMESLKWLNRVLFVACVVAFFTLGIVGFWRAVGLSVIIDGLVIAVWTRDIPVGIQMRPPSFHIRGTAAIAVGVLMIGVGAAVAWLAPDAVCYFSEGKQCS
jgi:hypothetical protein